MNDSAPQTAANDQAATAIRILPGQAERVETGPVQFGDDWPGLFIRGDQAGYLALQLQALLQLGTIRDPLAKVQLRALQQMLAGAIVGPAAAMLKAQDDWKDVCGRCAHLRTTDDGSRWRCAVSHARRSTRNLWCIDARRDAAQCGPMARDFKPKQELAAPAA